ncbi:MAG: hypothetical protein ACYTBJ_20640 [Planctomycetota bacterium]
MSDPQDATCAQARWCVVGEGGEMNAQAVIVWVVVGIICAILSLRWRPEWDGDVSEDARQRSMRKRP